MHPLPQGYHVYKLSTIYLARSKNSFMRIKNAYRWKVFEHENEEIRLHRKKRTSANSKEERDLTFLRHYIAHIENQ